MPDFNELYYRDSHMREFDAEVVSCAPGKNGYDIILTQTAFYPEGGGQPADHGTLNGTAVTDVHERNGHVVHTVADAIGEGTQVHGVIDWNRRLQHMQNHSGEHIVSGLIHRHFGLENVGFHMGEIIQIDFDGPVSWEDLLMIEREANEIIRRNVPVQETYPGEEELPSLEFRSKKELSGQVRIITVPEADICACCGTHVHTTGEIGLIRILSVQKHKKGIRAEMLAGKAAFEYTQKISEQNHQISNALSAAPLLTYDAVAQLQQASVDKDRKIAELTERLLRYRMAEFEDGMPLAMVFEKGVGRTSMVHFVNDLIEEKHAGTAAVFSGDDESGYACVILSHQNDLRACAKQMNAALNGRGGGTPEMYQGSFKASEQQIRETLSGLFAG